MGTSTSKAAAAFGAAGAAAFIVTTQRSGASPSAPAWVTTSGAVTAAAAAVVLGAAAAFQKFFLGPMFKPGSAGGVDGAIDNPPAAAAANCTYTDASQITWVERPATDLDTGTLRPGRVFSAAGEGGAPVPVAQWPPAVPPAATPGDVVEGFWEAASEPRIRLYYQWVIGRAVDPAPAPVVWLHGGPARPSSLAPAALRQLCAETGAHGFYFHQRGSGRSVVAPTLAGAEPQWPADEGPTAEELKMPWHRCAARLEARLGLGALTADVERVRLLLAAGGFLRACGRITLVGHSFGAIPALLYAFEWPRRVAGMALLAPASVLQMPIPKAEGGGLDALLRRYLPTETASGQPSRSGFERWWKEYIAFGAMFQKQTPALRAADDALQPFWVSASARKNRTAESASYLLASTASIGGPWSARAQFLSMGVEHDWRFTARRFAERASCYSSDRAGLPKVVFVHGDLDLQPVTVCTAIAKQVRCGFEAVTQRRAPSESRPQVTIHTIASAGHFFVDTHPLDTVAAIRRLVL